MAENKINCSVTVMPIYSGDEGQRVIGFIRRDKTDTLPGLLVAPGGKVEATDGELIDGVPYYSVEHAGLRELLEEAGLKLELRHLFYFCSLTLPNGRVVISLYTELTYEQYKQANEAGKLIWIGRRELDLRDDFAPGMKQEAALLFENT